jgi:Tfp pilus assembly protein PilX
MPRIEALGLLRDGILSYAQLILDIVLTLLVVSAAQMVATQQAQRPRSET